MLSFKKVAGEKQTASLKMNFSRFLSSYYGALILLGGEGLAVWSKKVTKMCNALKIFEKYIV